METEEFLLVVNGAEHTVSCEPDTPLLDVLRHDVGLAGPGFGCGIGLCGACMVLVGGRAQSSCNLPVCAVDGPVTTVEGLASGGRLHPVQQAFLDEQAAQCGYCTAGMMMAAVDLLGKNPAPAEPDVRAGMDGNLCRCGSHGRIVRAVLRAAGQVAGPPAAPRRTGNARPGPVAAGTEVVSAGGRALPVSLAANPVLGRWLDFGVPARSRSGSARSSTARVSGPRWRRWRPRNCRSTWPGCGWRRSARAPAPTRA